MGEAANGIEMQEELGVGCHASENDRGQAETSTAGAPDGQGRRGVRERERHRAYSMAP
jgi:hypothetical protein